MALTNVQTRNETFGGRVNYDFNQDYRSQSQDQQAVGLGAIGVGLVLFIIGIFMVATKSNSQRKKEMELQMLKSNQTKKSDSANNPAPVIDKNLKRYYTHDGTNQEGPFSYNDLEQRKINEETPIWVEGIEDWTAAGRIRSLLDLFKKVTPPPINSNQKEAAVQVPPVVKTPPVNKPDDKAKGGVVARASAFSPKRIFLIIGIIVVVVLVVFFIVDKLNQSSSNYNDSSDNYEERVKSVEEIERENPLDFLSVTGNYSENFWGDKIKIQCDVTNNATVAVYKDVVIKFSYYSKSETLLGTETETIYEVFEPNKTKSFNFKIPNYENTSSLGCDIQSARVKN